MNKHYAIIPTLLLAAASADAQQYCSPTFLNNCFSWMNQSISIGTINWTNADCLISDQTSLSAAVTAGTATQMSVTSGVWCGCAVWVDLNNDQTFQDSENLYYSYVGGDPGYTYDFDLTIPANTPTGSYRMRVIAPWGSDGFLDTNINGYGPCGSFQYGNFDDFTLNVSGTTGVEALTSTFLAAHPNPTTGTVWLDAEPSAPLQRIIVRSVDGRMVQDLHVGADNGQVPVDLGALPDGVYAVEGVSRAASRTVRVIKR